MAALQMKKKKKSRLEYRIQATRKMTGGKRILPGHHKDHKDEKTDETMPSIAEEADRSILVGFETSKIECDESCGTVTIKVHRSGIINEACDIKFDTSNGDAIAGDDYIAASGVLPFAAGEKEKEITITIIDDNEWAPDKHFYVRVFNEASPDQTANTPITFGLATCEVIILNDDDPGTCMFETKTVAAINSKKSVDLKIIRKDGYDGNVLVFLKTTDGTAKEGVDYVGLKGEEGEGEMEVAFSHEDKEKTVTIELLANPETKDISFSVEITAIEPEGAKIGENPSCQVIITDDKNYKKLVEEVAALMDEELHAYSVETSTWSEQFHNAMNMVGEDNEEPEFSDYLNHFFAFYWKVLHALVPPTDYYGGWATFVVSLCFIGGITCFVGDCAKMLGCCLGIEDSITAITFVALGTSLPDTFASMEATVSDDTADAAITNVTGSNSVNVFLGLGLPWTMATIYHGVKGTKYQQCTNPAHFPGGKTCASVSIAGSVMIFFAFATICIALLIYRRFYCDGELGGPAMVGYAHSAFLACSWAASVVVSATVELKI